MTSAQIVLGVGMSMLGCLAEPTHGFDFVFCYAEALNVAGAKPVLGVRVPLFGSFAEPAYGFYFVLCDTYSLNVAVA